MSSELTESKYNSNIPDDTIAVVISRAVLETEGVAGLAPTRTDVIQKNLPFKGGLHKGVRISKDDSGFSVDVFIFVMYDVNIPSVAWDLQKNIKRVLNSRFGITAQAINIHVQGVKFPADFRRS